MDINSPTYREETVVDHEFGFLGAIRSVTLREGDSIEKDPEGLIIHAVSTKEDIVIYKGQLQWSSTHYPRIQRYELPKQFPVPAAPVAESSEAPASPEGLTGLMPSQ